MEGVREELSRLKDVHACVVSFADAVVSEWTRADGTCGGESLADVRALLEPLFADAGAGDTSALWRAIAAAAPGPEQRALAAEADAVVPIENPVQMDTTPLSREMSAPARPVSLDWLATRRVVASQVDREKLARVVARHRARAERRGVRVASGGAATLPEMEGASPGPESDSWDARAVVDDLLAAEDGGDGAEGRGPRDIVLEDFDVGVAGRRILSGASLVLAAGRRYGLVGRNGVGKSTLLRHISSRALPVPARLSILHVAQEAPGDDRSALETVLAADFRRAALLEEEARLQAELGGVRGGAAEREHAHRLAGVHRLLAAAGDGATARAASILAGLGFSAEMQAQRTSSFSGGWRMRVALARALFCEPDVLLLDEPTNMLDFPAVVWLEARLQAWRGTVLVVSHDRCFLDNVATDVLHMAGERLAAYRGNYAAFVAAREERAAADAREYAAQVQYRAHLQAFVDRWRYNAARAAQAQSRLRILERLPPLRPVVAEAPVVFRFPEVDAPGAPLVQLDAVSFSYGERPILAGVDFALQPGGRVAIVGPNGAGKTTLLRLIVGALEPSSGRAVRSGRVRVGLFAQHHVEHLDPAQTGLQIALGRLGPERTPEECRAALGAFGLSGPLALQPVATLSGGQKSRLAFALLAAARPHVLVLDEPTNHLDMDSIDALVAALRDYAGAAVVVSHDKRFVEALGAEIWVCAHTAVRRFEGSIHDYAQSLLAE